MWQVARDNTHSACYLKIYPFRGIQDHPIQVYFVIAYSSMFPYYSDAAIMFGNCNAESEKYCM